MKRAKITSSNPDAWIVSPKDKGRKSIKNGKVFLKNKSEFEIELFNPLTDCVLADIRLNGQSISKTGLVIKPGQRVYLDCFIDDRKKFVFNTYDVEDTTESIEATSKNGLLEVLFYKENVFTINNWGKYYPVWVNYPNIRYDNLNEVYGSNLSNVNSVYGYKNGSNLSSLNAVYDYKLDSSLSNISTSNTFETGRIEKGETSTQNFTEIDMNFEENYISSTVIQILPESKKPKEIKEVYSNKVNKEHDNIIDLIKKLSELYSSGILTEKEFLDKKSELLSKL